MVNNMGFVVNSKTKLVIENCAWPGVKRIAGYVSEDMVSFSFRTRFRGFSQTPASFSRVISFRTKMIARCKRPGV